MINHKVSAQYNLSVESSQNVELKLKSVESRNKRNMQSKILTHLFSGQHTLFHTLT